jgi:hypothetical protein
MPRLVSDNGNNRKAGATVQLDPENGQAVFTAVMFNPTVAMDDETGLKTCTESATPPRSTRPFAISSVRIVSVSI